MFVSRTVFQRTVCAEKEVYATSSCLRDIFYGAIHERKVEVVGVIYFTLLHITPIMRVPPHL